jgi:voltage-gated potassium channel Kch
MTSDPSNSADSAGTRHVIIVGFGLSGRSCANALIAQHVSICVIEKNPVTVERCALGGLQITQGDASDEETLRHAGIERATEVAITIPEEEGTLRVLDRVKRMNPRAHVIARCTFVSGGMEAVRRGANEVVVAEQVVAAEFSRIMKEPARRP